MRKLFLRIAAVATLVAASFLTPGSPAQAANQAFTCHPGMLYTFVSYGTGHEVGVEYGYTGADYAMLRAAYSNRQDWFTCQTFTGGYVAFKSNGNQLYVAAEVNYSGGSDGMLRARSGSVGSWEQFTVSCSYVTPDTYISDCSLKSRGTGKYVAAEVNYPGGYDGMLRARSGSVGSWETFQISTY